MPGYDKTGPMGQGPRTGGGFGVCSAEIDEELRGVGRGGMPWGGGRGRCFGGNRRGFKGRGRASRLINNNQEVKGASLNDQIAQLIADNKDLRARLAELESKQQE